MKHLLSLVATCSLLLVTSFAVSTREEVLEAIAILERLEAKPEVLAEAAQLVITFGNDSDDVAVLVNRSASPWLLEEWGLGQKETKTVRSLLVGSYVAGSVKHQLTTGKADMNPYPGWLLANRTYQAIKSKWKFTSPGAEKLCLLEKQGKLRAHAAEVMKEE